MSAPEPLTVVQAAAIEGSSELEWLIEGLWVAEGVGIVGGNPKAGLWCARHKPAHAASRLMPRGNGQLLLSSTLSTV